MKISVHLFYLRGPLLLSLLFLILIVLTVAVNAGEQGALLAERQAFPAASIPLAHIPPEIPPEILPGFIRELCENVRHADFLAANEPTLQLRGAIRELGEFLADDLRSTAFYVQSARMLLEMSQDPLLGGARQESLDTLDGALQTLSAASEDVEVSINVKREIITIWRDILGDITLLTHPIYPNTIVALQNIVHKLEKELMDKTLERGVRRALKDTLLEIRSDPRLPKGILTPGESEETAMRAERPGSPSKAPASSVVSRSTVPESLGPIGSEIGGEGGGRGDVQRWMKAWTELNAKMPHVSDQYLSSAMSIVDQFSKIVSDFRSPDISGNLQVEAFEGLQKMLGYLTEIMNSEIAGALKEGEEVSLREKLMPNIIEVHLAVIEAINDAVELFSWRVLAKEAYVSTRSTVFSVLRKIALDETPSVRDIREKTIGWLGFIATHATLEPVQQEALRLLYSLPPDARGGRGPIDAFVNIVVSGRHRSLRGGDDGE